MGIFEPLGRVIDKAEFHLTGTEAISLNDDGVTWTKVPNMVGTSLVGFSAADGTLTKTVKTSTLLVNGVSDVQVNKACTIYYGLFVNGAVVPSEITEHTFASPSKVATISITSIATLTPNDTVEIYVLGDGVTSGVTVTTAKLDVTFWNE
jgi:hypothetical protein